MKKYPKASKNPKLLWHVSLTRYFFYFKNYFIVIKHRVVKVE